jgi:transposase
VPNGGVLIQDLTLEGVQINEGGSVVVKPPPIIIYSAQEVHVKNGDEEYVYAPLIDSTEEKILESMLTMEDIYKLASVQYWREVGSSFSAADYIRYVLILVQFVVLPLALYNLIISIRTTKKIKEVSTGKRNYKINRNEYLLKRVK